MKLNTSVSAVVEEVNVPCANSVQLDGGVVGGARKTGREDQPDSFTRRLINHLGISLRSFRLFTGCLHKELNHHESETFWKAIHDSDPFERRG